MPSMINNTTEFHPFRWLAFAALAVALAYLAGVGTVAPAPAAQCTYVPPLATTPAPTR